MRTFQKTIFCIISILTAVWLQGCTPEHPNKASITTEKSAESPREHERDINPGDSYASAYRNRSSEDFFCYKTKEYITNILDYESMNNAPLCNKPNCNHKTKDCIVRRLDGNVPVFGEHCAYYFLDQEPEIEETKDGKIDLKLSSDLYCYDLRTNAETKLFHADASVSENCYGWLMHDDVLYYIDNQYGRSYDETGSFYGYGNTGGKMSLCMVRLSDLQMTVLCELYDPEKLTEYYPLAPNSGEVYMKGFYNNKIYFNVGFVDEKRPQENQYCFYVTYYDLSDGTYHGTPEDYGNIDFAAVTYCSANGLVICRDGEASVTRKTDSESVLLTHPCFNQRSVLTVIDNTIFCDGKAFDLNTKEVKEPAVLKDKSVVARYGDSFIIADADMQSGFEKIPAEKLLN